MSDFPGSDKKPQSQECCGRQTEAETIVASPAVSTAELVPKVPWIIGLIETPICRIPVISTLLEFADTLGSWKARWGIGRMNFRVQPRLYAVGKPTNESPVFVTANYKMSFDRLRSQLHGIDAWILVLETKGINVWCAAGKGLFGTSELLNRIDATDLKRIVSHRRLIIPQLGATGVSAHAVRESSGFHVSYGPVRAKDIRAFLQAGMNATPEMRRITFTFCDRIVLVPADIVGNFRYAIIAGACFLVLSGFGTDIYSTSRVVQFGLASGALVFLAALCGAVLPALLLPWLPGRAFSVKGAVAGIIPVLGLILWRWMNPHIFRNWLSLASWLLLFPAVSSFIAMNFTGSSTYTSLSGVKKEVRIALPVQFGIAACGLVLWITGLLI
jgi:hypothetical protein